MKSHRSFFLRLCFAMLLIVGFDLSIKEWAWTFMTDGSQFGPFVLYPKADLSFVFGFGESLPGGTLALFSAALTSVLIALWVAALYFLPISARAVPAAIMLLSAGFLSNTIDRLIRGFVVGFFSIDLPAFRVLHVNLADMTIFAGSLLLLYGITFGSSSPFRPQKFRRSNIINTRYQIKFCAYLQGALTMGAAGVWLCSWAFYKHGGGNALDWKCEQSVAMSSVYLLTLGFMFLSLSIITWVIGFAVSHRVAGALFRFNHVVRSTLDGRPEPLRLRVNDDFREILTPLSEEIQKFAAEHRTDELESLPQPLKRVD